MWPGKIFWGVAAFALAACATRPKLSTIGGLVPIPEEKPFVPPPRPDFLKAENCPGCLIFKPGKVTPEWRGYAPGQGATVSRDVLDRLDRDEIKHTLIEAIAIPSPSFHERRFAEWVIQKFQEIGVDAGMDDSLERFKKLLPEVKKELAGDTMPDSGNVVAYIPPPNPKLELPSFQFSFHLDTRADDDTGVEERDGRLWARQVGNKIILGADDKAGFAELYHVLKVILEARLPHGGITVTGLWGEEAGGAGAKLLRREWKRGDIGIVPDGARTDEVYNAGADIYFGSCRIADGKPEPIAPTPFSERFSLAFQGAPQHPAFPSISAIALATQTLKGMKTAACGTVGDDENMKAYFLEKANEIAREASENNYGVSFGRVLSLSR